MVLSCTVALAGSSAESLPNWEAACLQELLQSLLRFRSAAVLVFMAAKLSSFWGNWMSPSWPRLALLWSLSCPVKRSPSFPRVEGIAWLGFHFRHLPWAFFLMSPNVGHDHRLIQYQNLLDFLNKLLLKCKTGGIFHVKGPRPCRWKALR